MSTKATTQRALNFWFLIVRFYVITP